MIFSESLDTLSPEWRDWHMTICKLLDINPSAPVNSQRLPKPWFLVPNRNEILADQLPGLVKTVTTYLYANGQTTKGVRTSLLNLDPDASLLFLYAMRYIAFTEAGKRSFWPEFRRVLFENNLQYKDIAVGLAETTSTLWLRFYEYTNGALYFPREGPRHIKWPLAHAGLISSDKELLLEFGISAFTASEELYRSMLEQEIDEFILLFNDWVAVNPIKRNERFSQLLRSNQPSRFIVAELAQHWLTSQREKILARKSVDAIGGATSFHLSRQLVYDDQSNQIGLKLKPGRTAGRNLLAVDWQDKKVTLPSQYLESTDETLGLEYLLPLKESTWADSIRVQVGAKEYVCGIPKLENKKSAVFDASTGAQTKRWEFASDYYLLIPVNSLKDEGLLDNLLQDRLQLQEPRGDWSNHRLFWARTTDPIPEHGEDAVSIIGKLESASDALGLPSFGDQYRIRVRLVGTELLNEGDHNRPAFLCSEKPVLEIIGISDRQIDISLSRIELSGQPNVLSTFSIRDGLENAYRVLEICGEEAREGVFRVEVNNIRKEFILVDTPDASHLQDKPGARIDVSFFNDGNSLIEFSRHAIEEVELQISAWAYAEILLEILDESSYSIYSQILILEDDGTLVQPLSTLPIDLSSLPSGDTVFRFTWRGLFARELRLVDKEYVGVKNIQFNLVRQDEVFNLTCQGILRGASEKKSYKGLLLSDPPFKDKTNDFDLRIRRDGSFTGEASLKWKPTWLVLTSQSKDGSTNVLAVIQLEARQADEFQIDEVVLENLLMDYSESWSTLASKIKNVPYPPAIQTSITLEPLLSLLKRFDLNGQNGKSWHYFSRADEIPKLEEYFKLGFTAALFTAETRGKQAQEVDSVHLDFDLATDKVKFRYKNGDVTGIIEGGQKFGAQLFLLPQATYRSCSKCNLLFPSQKFFGHKAPYKELGDCTGIMPSFTDLSSESEKPIFVNVGILADPWQLVYNLAAQLKELLKSSEIKSDYLPIIKELRLIAPRDADQRKWVENLACALENLHHLSSSELILEDDLLKTARVVEEYQEAISLVLSFAQSQVSFQ